MNSVVVVDLGMGNLRSVARACERAGARVRVASDPAQIRSASRLVVPGQGAFRQCAHQLGRGMGEALREAISEGVPYLGICLGMQLLFERSEEAPGALGLGLFRGTVRRFQRNVQSGDRRLKVPHMGWNQITTKHTFLRDQDWFYFVHSYVCEPEDPTLVVATSNYGSSFCAAIARERLFACQFHPEKSQHAGDRLLHGFLERRWS